MKADEAMLLPKLYKDFTQEVYTHIASFSSVNFSESDIPSSRWLLSHLHLHFEDMIEVQCRQRRYGTLVYHKNCDLVHALSSALGRHEIIAEATSRSKSKEAIVEPPLEDIQDHMQKVALYLNKKLHVRANTQRESFNQIPENIAVFDLGAALETVDPELFSFLSVMTQPVRHSRRKLFENRPATLEQNSHTKKHQTFLRSVCASILHELCM